jgi:polysaccharide pyruvyl transferase WcaK-like protein
VTALIQNIRQRIPGAEICCFSFSPDDTQQRHGVPAFPIRHLQRKPAGTAGQRGDAEGAGPALQTPPWGIKAWLKQVPLLYRTLRLLRETPRHLVTVLGEMALVGRSMRLLRRTDLLIVAGGGQLGDYFGGPWEYPLTLCKWSVMARAAGCRLAFVSVGAGPIVSAPGRRLLKWSLALAHYRSFRDTGSRELVERIGVRGPNHIFPDLAQSLDITGSRATEGGNGRPFVVGINPLPYFDRRYWAEHSDEVYGHYVHTLAAFATWLIGRGHRVLFFPTQLRADPPVIRDVETELRRIGPACLDHALLQRPVSSFDDLLAAIDTTDLIVASRFHGVVISYLMRKPVLGLAYQPKTEQIMVAMGQGMYALKIEAITVDSLVACFLQLESDLAEASLEIDRRQKECRQRLDVQYDWLFRGAAPGVPLPADDRNGGPAGGC